MSHSFQPRSSRATGPSSSSSNSNSNSSRNSSSRVKPQLQRQKQQTPNTAASPVAADSQQGEWLAKALASSGVASRRACIDLVKAGKVQVNGSVITDPATKVDLNIDKLIVEGRKITTAAAITLWHFAVHKPVGYICSNVSKQPGMRAVDLLQPWLDKWQQKHKGQLPPRLFTVGRLDVATSGLLFITNDGDWANQVIHPSGDITKEYWVTLPQDPTPKQLQLLRTGTVIEGVQVVPKVVKILQSCSHIQQQSVQQTAAMQSGSGSGRNSRRNGGSSSGRGGKGGGRGGRDSAGDAPGRCVLQLDVSEGKKHEVRLLVAAAGLKLLQLKRVRVGGFVMPQSLQPGQYMELSPAMQAKVFKMKQ